MIRLPALIADLQRAGLTQCDIAQRSGLAQSTISALASGLRGKRPSMKTAVALHELWCLVCDGAAAHAKGAELRQIRVASSRR